MRFSDAGSVPCSQIPDTRKDRRRDSPSPIPSATPHPGMGRVAGTRGGVTPSEASAALLTFVLGVGKVSFPCLLSVNEKRPNQEPGSWGGKGGQRPAWGLRVPGGGLGDRIPHARGPFFICISGAASESPEKDCMSGPSASEPGRGLAPICTLQTHRKL